tara:strand:- start:9044 stop:10303 length:1260 start_codon:yes stop_codon:yes gene_type:complete
LEEFKAFLSNSDIQNYEDYCLKIEKYIKNKNSDKLNDIKTHIQNTKSFNETIYIPKNVEDYKVRYWPNNEKLLETRWEAFVDIYEANFCLKPNRFITNETVIASAGSCFARNIALQLQDWGYNYKIEMGKDSKKINNPLEYESDPAQCGHIFNSSSLKYMIARAFGEWTPEKIAMRQNPNTLELFRGYSNSQNLEDYFEIEWEKHNKALNIAMKNCEVFILTLGNTEVWTLSDTEEPLARSPAAGCDVSLMKVKNQSVDEVLADLEDFYKIFKKYNSKIKIIASVSPVPLNATFNDNQHVVVANSLSKSTLRVALEYFAKKHPKDVYYFPALEIVTYGSPKPWKSNKRHVHNDAINKVMQAFKWTYMKDQSLRTTIWEPDVKLNTKPNYFLKYIRKWIVHPMKRKLGIYGKSFSYIWKK